MIQSCVFWSAGLKTTEGLAVLDGGRLGRSAVFPYLVCMSLSLPKFKALIGQASTHAGSLFCSNLSMHMVHLDAFAVGESLSNKMAPYGQAFQAALMLGLLA